MRELEEFLELTAKFINPIYDYYKSIDTEVDEDLVTPSKRRQIERSINLAEMEKDYLMEILEYMDKILDRSREYEEDREDYE